MRYIQEGFHDEDTEEFGNDNPTYSTNHPLNLFQSEHDQSQGGTQPNPGTVILSPNQTFRLEIVVNSKNDDDKHDDPPMATPTDINKTISDDTMDWESIIDMVRKIEGRKQLSE